MSAGTALNCPCATAESGISCLSCGLLLVNAALFLAALLAVRVHAQSPLPQYVTTVWRTEQGLPQNSVNAMLQDNQGYLWIGTFAGLARFDGERFTMFDSGNVPSLGNNGILALYQSPAGALWIGTLDAGLIRLVDRIATTYTERDGLPSRFVSSIRGDREGNVWINTSGGVARFSGKKLEPYPMHRGKPVREFFLQARDGSMWFRCGGDVVRFGADGVVASFHPVVPSVFLVDQAQDGSVWIAFRDKYRLVHYHDGIFSYLALPSLGRRKLVRDVLVFSLAMTRDADGQLLLLTPAGLVRIVDGKLTPAEPLSFTNSGEQPRVRSFLVDREGNLWVGTIGMGLIRLRQAPLTAYGKDEGLSDTGFNAIFRDREGRIWLGGDLLYCFDGRRFQLIPGVEHVRAIAQTRDGDLWFGGYRDLQRWRSGVLTSFNVGAWPVRAIYQDREGTLWIGALMEERPGGLYRLRDGKLQQIPGISDVSKILEDRNGGLWIAGIRNLSYIRDRKTVVYDRNQGLPDHSVDLLQDSTGTLWIASYGGGLTRLRDGRLKTITTQDGLPNNMLAGLLEDGRGNLWVSSTEDVFCLSLKQLNEVADGRVSSVFPISYGVAEGMRSSESDVGSPVGLETNDGRIWFATMRGVVAIDPGAGNHLPPPVVLEEAWANKLPLAITSRSSVPPGNSTLDFRFTALSFADPDKLRFRYRLDPFDKNWVDAGTHRTAHYTNMGPGEYSFHVLAANDFGIWSDQEANVRFMLLPHFYQTRWFMALCAALFLGALWAIYLWRLRQLHHQFEMTLDARVSERTRIARDLHDTLLQSFQGLLLHFQSVSQLLPNRPIDAKEKLEGAIDKAAVAITEGRDAVQGLRTSAIESNDLADSLDTLGAELAADPANGDGPPPEFQVTVEGQSRNLHPMLRDEVFRVAAEALRNAFRHARASRVEVEIRYDDQQFRLRVRDDGCGMDAAVLSGQEPKGHFGLSGMMERARLAGGKLVIWSSAGAGAEVELRISAENAYLTANRHSWLSDKIAEK